MSLSLLKTKGTPVEKQVLPWREMVRPPFSKLDVDAFTRIRVILMNGIEMEALRFSHGFARMDRGLRKQLAAVRRAEQFQQITVNWLLPADQSPLETTIAYEQVAIEVTAALAQQEPDPYLAQILRFGLLEDFDHLYRYSALLDRLEGKDANTILQSYTDIHPGRATAVEHRHPHDDIRNSYDKKKADPISKFNSLTIMAGEQQTQNYYLNFGPTFADPLARSLYAEIATIEEQHVTQYESLIDPDETWMEKWLLHEATEVYNYWSCVESETDPRVKGIWEQFLDYELGHLQVAMNEFKRVENRDPAEILPETISQPIAYRSHREYVRQVLRDEVDLRANGPEIVPKAQESKASIDFRKILNAGGVPTDIVAEGYVWSPGGELARRAQSEPKTQQTILAGEGARV